MIPVILSGGSGTRLWPVSRNQLPKQFCDIFTRSLQNLTLLRALKLGDPFILTSQHLKDHTEKDLRKLISDFDTFSERIRVIYEPEARNTAPALAYLCWTLIQQGKGDEVCAVFPSDHLIENEQAFIEAVKVAESEAKKNQLAIIGILPSSPATGYGYIETRPEQQLHAGLAARKVVRFYEKPSLENAAKFVADGNFFWNAGMFVFKPSYLLKLFEQHAPEVIRPLANLKPDLSNLSQVYAETKKISFDYAVVEKLGSQDLSCIPCDMGWSDVGSWDSVASILSKSPQSKHAQGTVLEAQASGNYVHSDAKKVYAFSGTHNLIVVDTPDALLITTHENAQSVKEISQRAKSLGLRAADFPLNEERPWGNFEVLKDTQDFKSKVVSVEPKGKLSLQMHQKREEHWLVVKGSGEVTLNDALIKVQKGSYVKIPKQAKHRIFNSGMEDLVFVEVQLGDYFGEDDIQRFQDDYQRT